MVIGGKTGEGNLGLSKRFEEAAVSL